MPQVLYIWFAENLGAFATAWVCPSQQHGWSILPIGKIGAWRLLVILSMALATFTDRPQARLSDSAATAAA
jgi:uncharacterized membrane protein YoaT (DUF817 family)